MTESSPQHPGIDAKLDVAALKVLAHPLRVRILDELSMYGPLTASGLGERLGESSGATSYHLRQLEKVGLVQEDTSRGTARERWWERKPGSISTYSLDFAEGSVERLSSQLIEEEWNRNRETNFREFSANPQLFSQAWLDAASADTINVRLTAEQLHSFVQDVDVVIWKYLDAYKKTPSPGSRPVQIHLNAFPLVRGVESAADAASDVGGTEKNS